MLRESAVAVSAPYKVQKGQRATWLLQVVLREGRRNYKYLLIRLFRHQITDIYIKELQEFNPCLFKTAQSEYFAVITALSKRATKSCCVTVHFLTSRLDYKAVPPVAVVSPSGALGTIKEQAKA